MKKVYPYTLSEVKILFVGDIFGSAGRHIVHEHLPQLVETHAVDLLVINGENAAGGFGITPALAEELFDLGAHVITTGNHIWDKREIFDYMAVPAASHERGRRILRPANYAVGTPGFGVYQGTLPAKNGNSLCRHQHAGPRLHELLRRSLPQSRRSPAQIKRTLTAPRSSSSTSTPKPPAKKSP